MDTTYDAESVEKLEQFSQVILSDAADECAEIYKEIKRESEIAKTAAEDDALADTFRYIKAEISKITIDCGKRLSRTMMDNKRALYSRREEMSDEIRDLVVAKIKDYVQTESYALQLESLTRRIVGEFGADTVIYLRQDDMDKKERLENLGLGHKLTFKQGGFKLGGLEADCPDRKLHVDETFDTTLLELRGHFSELLGLKLSE